MKKILFTGLCAFMTITVFSQANYGYFDMHARTIDINEKSLAFGLTEAEFESIKDEAYTNPNFVEGNIYQENQLMKSYVPMRYNSFADEIEIKKNMSDENYFALTKDPNIFVKMRNDIYVFVPHQDGKDKGGYFNVLNDGKTYDLYKRTTSIFREPQKARTSYERDSPPSFEKTVKYYLVQNGTFMEMPSSKSKVLKVMNSKKDEIKAFIKSNNLDIDKEADLIKVVAYFDSLT